MSQPLTRKNWPLGWTPSADLVNGSPEGLLRMDNLQQEEDGSIGIVRGFRELGNAFPDFVSDIYSKVINGQELIWVGLNLGREIFRTDLNFGAQTLISSGGGTRPAFGDGLGQVIACSGSQKKKDDGTTIRDLGITSQLTAPKVTSVSQSQIDLFNSGGGTWGIEEGTFIASGGTTVQFNLDPTRLEGIASVVFDSKVDTTDTGDGPATDPNQDTFFIRVQLADTSIFTKVRVELYLDDSFYQNYFWFEWPLEGSTAYQLGIDAQSILSATRGSFNRQGSDTNVGWKTVTKIRVIAQANSMPGAFGFLCGEARFVGGAAGQLNGLYTYVQLDVYDNGLYIAKGAPSPPSLAAYIFNGRANIGFSSSSDSQVNQSWLFRKSVVPDQNVGQVINVSGQNIDAQLPTGLAQYYRVAVGAPGGSVVDSLSDQDAIEQNITLNLFLISLKDITDPIIGMEGIYNERMLYLTPSQILLSNRLNIDAIDPRYSIKAFGDPSELNLTLKKINNNTLILFTTKDHYTIAGTLLDLPDGSIDVNVQPIGEAYPALSQDCTATDGAIFYMASQGWRVTTGSNSLPIDSVGGASKLSLLFQGMARFGVPPFISNPGNTTRYSVAIGRGKFYAIAQCGDGTRRLVIFDLKRGTWRLQLTDPVIIHTTLSDRILLGYGSPSNSVQEMEYGTDASIDGNEGQAIFLRTILDDFGLPRNRKDTFTLKLVLNTGGQPVNVGLAIDSESYSQLPDSTGNTSISTSGIQTVYFDLKQYTLGFRYSLQITNVDTTLVLFKLYEATIEYAPRPEQNVFLRILNDNFGNYSRKRYTAYALVIDTLGHPVTLTPIVDDVAQAPLTINTNSKDQIIYYFTSETLGTQIGATLEGQHPFEFYGVDLQQTVSETLPTPVEFLIIPANDYGSPNRKRHTSYKFQINTRGTDVVFTPVVDGIAYATAIFNTSVKKTVDYYFDTSIDDIIGVDIGGILDSNGSGTPFEFYGVIVPQQIEELPPLLRSFVIPSTDYGTPNPKRHTSYKFQINTFGNDVQFKPKLDDQYLDSVVVNTERRQTVEIFLNQNNGDVLAVDIGGRLQSLEATPFEFYGNVVPQTVDTLPPRLTSLFTSEQNYGVPARKRFRTIPFIIDTHGLTVDVTPIVDGTVYPTISFTTGRKSTCFYYFETDVFGIDFAFQIQSAAPIGGDTGQESSVPFEFYGFGDPIDVETLPVGRVFDQLGPTRFDKIGKMFKFRIRMVAFENSIPYTVYGGESTVPTYSVQDDTSGVITTEPGVDQIYEVHLPKSINGPIFRIVLGPSEIAFHRYDCQIQVAESGMETSNTWVPIR